MIDSYYINYSGMQAASDGLNLISDNMANMNTPGFKGSQGFFSNIGGDYSGFSLWNDGDLGYGAYRSKMQFDFSQGDLRQMGDSGNNAIDGQGFFIMNFHGETRYTRDGEFHFVDGILMDDRTGAHIQGFNSKGILGDISLTDQKTNPGKADSFVHLKGTIVPKKDADGKWEPQKQTIQIYGSDGELHKITITLTVDSIVPVVGDKPDTWDIEITVENGLPLMLTGNNQIKFDFNGYPDEGFNTIQFKFRGKGLNDTDVTLNFGDPHYNTGVICEDNIDKSKSTQFDVSDDKDARDGYGIGTYLGFTIDDKGKISFQYSNGQKTEGATLALANFEHPQQLRRVDNNAFIASDGMEAHIARAGEGALGLIKSGYIELSNINSSVEFANIVIFQRIFQASAEIMQINKQILEKLYGGSGGNG